VFFFFQLLVFFFFRFPFLLEPFPPFSPVWLVLCCFWFWRGRKRLKGFFSRGGAGGVVLFFCFFFPKKKGGRGKTGGRGEKIPPAVPVLGGRKLRGCEGARRGGVEQKAFELPVGSGGGGRRGDRNSLRSKNPPHHNPKPPGGGPPSGAGQFCIVCPLEGRWGSGPIAPHGPVLLGGGFPRFCFLAAMGGFSGGPQQRRGDAVCVFDGLGKTIPAGFSGVAASESGRLIPREVWGGNLRAARAFAWAGSSVLPWRVFTKTLGCMDVLAGQGFSLPGGSGKKKGGGVGDGLVG